MILDLPEMKIIPTKVIKKFVISVYLRCMARKKYLLLMAGGSGTRMRAAVPKQFLDLDGKAVLHRTLDRFMEADPDIRVITVLPEAYFEYWKNYCAVRNVVARQTVVRGGISRFHSVRNALGAVPDGALVAVHDGARPLLSAGLVSRMFRQAEHVPALIPVIPSTDTLRALRRDVLPDGTEVFETVPDMHPDRNMLFRVQTPQIFYSEVLKAAYGQPYDMSFTDDASVAERFGIPLAFISGEALNIKITTPEDFMLAQKILPAQRFPMQEK